MSTLGKNVKRARESFGWSQTELAQRAGVSQQIITRIETGKARETKKIINIATAFGLSVEALLALTDTQLAAAKELVSRSEDVHFLRQLYSLSPEVQAQVRSLVATLAKTVGK